MREQSVSEAEKVTLQLDKFPIQIVDVNKELAYEAAKLKGEFRIAYADCFAAALSVKLNADLVTGDPDFKKLHERISILEQNAANDATVSDAVRLALEYHYQQEHGEKSIIAMLQTEYYKEKR